MQVSLGNENSFGKQAKDAAFIKYRHFHKVKNPVTRNQIFFRPYFSNAGIIEEQKFWEMGQSLACLAKIRSKKVWLQVTLTTHNLNEYFSRKFSIYYWIISFIYQF